MIIFFNFCQRRIFKMLNSTDCSLRTISIHRPQPCKQSLPGFLPVIIKSPVFLLIHSLQFRMKQSHLRIPETLRLNRSPVFQLIRRHIILINRLLQPSMRIRTLCTYRRHHFIILIRNRKLRCIPRNTINLMINHLPFRHIRRLSVHLIQSLNFIQLRLLLPIFLTAVCISPLEQHMLQIVRQTSRISRVILASRSRSNIRLYPRRIFIHRHINSKSIVKRINTRIQRVIRHTFIFISLLRNLRNTARNKHYRKQKCDTNS